MKPRDIPIDRTKPNIPVTAFPEEVLHVISMLKSHKFEAYVVGGCVRDILLGQKPHDFDVTTNATPEEVMGIFDKVIPTGIKHGTVTVLKDNEKVEVTTFRTEGAYTDGRHPDDVKFVSDIKEDLSRRDFTINAMAYDPFDEVLVDPFDGTADLQRRCIRCVGVAGERFKEDGLRLMRAIRFACRFGFKLDSLTYDFIGIEAKRLENVSKERIRDEFTKILVTPNVKDGLWMLNQTGLLRMFMPELYRRPVIINTVATVEARLAGLFANMLAVDIDFVMREMKFSNDEIETVTTFVTAYRELTNLPVWSDEICRRFWSKFGGREQFEPVSRFLEGMGFHNIADESKRVIFDFRASGASFYPALTIKELAVKGLDVMAAGAKGRTVGVVLSNLLEKVLEDPSMNTKPRLLQQIEAMKQTMVF